MPRVHTPHRVAVLAALLCAGSSWAAVVSDNFDPGDGYNVFGGWAVSGASSFVGADFDAAMSFVPIGTFRLDAVDLAASLDPSVGGTNTLDVSLVADSGGAPGTVVLESFHFSNAMGPLGSVNPLLHADSTLRPVLTSGATYWLVVSASGDTFAMWNYNNGDALGGDYRSGGGAWNASSDDPTGAFRILGTPVSETVGTIHVKTDGNDTNDGSTWALAKRTVQGALSSAGSGAEIWVAAGVYRPTDGTDRSATFQLKNGVAIYGGFAGAETERADRNWQSNVTTFSGDIGAAGAASDNSYHVVTGSGTDSTALLDGFVITGGNAGGAPPANCGGGMYNSSGNPSLVNITFSGNRAVSLGGAMFNSYSSPSLANVTFSGNSAANGAGMWNTLNSSPILTNVTFSANSATGWCGGMYSESYSSATLTNVAFIANSAGEGGGMENRDHSSPTLVNVSFLGNSAGASGGGMYNAGYSNPTLANVVFSGNSALDGGAIFNSGGGPTLTNVTLSGNSAASRGGAICNVGGGNVAVRNTILWGNASPSGAQIYNYSDSIVTVSYSDAQGGYPGTGNIAGDPRFANAVGPDGMIGTVDDDLRLGIGSAAVDAADGDVAPPTDKDGNPRYDVAGVPNTGIGTPDYADMGAYEQQFLNRPPVADAGPDQTLEQMNATGAEAMLDGSGSSDADGDPLVYVWREGDLVIAGPSGNPVSQVALGPGTHSITLAVYDSQGGADENNVVVVVQDTRPPLVDLVEAAPNPGPVNQNIALTATANDLASGGSNIVSAEYSIDGGSWVPMQAADGAFDEASEALTATIPPLASAGVLHVSVRATDTAGNASEPVEILLVIYDPEGGFVTGGGWIYSLPGAYPANESLEGKAVFGFVSKYKKGATIPTGETEFQFKMADLNFRSDSYDWLVVAGAKAQYKGTGTVNGDGEYGFLLTAIDGALPGGGDMDKFRIKIWNKSTGAPVYDNQMGAPEDEDPVTALGGGSIVIHKQ